MTKLKICGMKNAQDIALLADLPVDYVGLVFHSESIRCVELDKAKDLVERVLLQGKIPVAVCVDQTIDKMKEIVEHCDIQVIQLHGDVARSEHMGLPEHVARIFVLHVGPEGRIVCGDLTGLDPKRDFLLFDGLKGGSGKTIVTDNIHEAALGFRYFIAGGVNPDNVHAIMESNQAYGIDVSSGVEQPRGHKSKPLIQKLVNRITHGGIQDKEKTQFGAFGGIYMPESLIAPIEELAIAFQDMQLDAEFQEQLGRLSTQYAGRETPLTEVSQFAKSSEGPARVFLKREDMLHTGAHKINNALGQCLLAKKMGKTRIIAETGAGQHGVATATACAHLDLECIIYMGAADIERQRPNVEKMRLLGAEVVSVETGSKTLKDSVNAALRDYAASFVNTHYCLGSALGPYPFPQMVGYFQSVIGKEIKEQCQVAIGRDPDMLIACIGGGSNAIGMFMPFIGDENVKMVGVEAGGTGKLLGQHAARFEGGKKGVLHGCYSYVLQDDNGQIAQTHSISAGLDYPMIGPHHAALYDSGQASYTSVTDDEALVAFKQLSRTEGIIPALESSHALAYYLKIAKALKKSDCVVINLSGSGDKDLPQLIAKGVL